MGAQCIIYTDAVPVPSGPLVHLAQTLLLSTWTHAPALLMCSMRGAVRALEEGVPATTGKGARHHGRFLQRGQGARPAPISHQSYWAGRP